MTNQANQILNNLSEQEREQVLKILSEYQTKGTSDQLNKIKYQDYKEIPVDIITFIKDRKYLGDAWHDSRGRCKLYPYWEKRLKELFPDNISIDYNSAIFTGSRGLGKSEMAVTIGLYLMYRVMCLKNPHDYFGLKPTERIAFAFLNITIELAESIGVAKFQETVKLSPWFMERGTLTPRSNFWEPPSYINIIIGSQSSDVIGQAVLFAFFDEISFIKRQDIERQKQIAIDMIDTAIGGMKTRFIKDGRNYSLLILASSKRTEKSFLETHMKAQAQIEGVRNFIVDEPVWNVKPPETYSGKRFYVALGNKYLQSEVIPDDSDTETYRRRGYKIISVPIEFYSDFRLDIDRALCDFAGIASSDLSTYISGVRLAEAKNYEIKNPFTNDVLEVSDDPKDTSQYYDYLDESLVNYKFKKKPLFVHLDMSISGDKTGIAGVCIAGLDPVSRDVIYKLMFSVSIKAPKGRQVSFAKNVQFIKDLKAHGWNVRGVSSDTFQNAAVAQDLQSAGFNYKIISVDRVNTDKICEPYLYLKNSIYNKRIILYDSPLLTEEFLALERNNNTGKVDHPEHGSKDQSDAVCGALYHASQHQEEYSFEYGEDLVNKIPELNQTQQSYKEQIKADFEESLKQTFATPIFRDFGMGQAQKASLKKQMDISSGILIW